MKNMKFFKSQKNIFVIAILLSFSAIYSAYSWGSSTSTNNLKYFRQFQAVFDRIERDYVTEPDRQKMLDSALEGMLSALDPHSSYFTDADLEEFKNHTKGEFGGIGVEIIYDSGAIKVISPIDDLPAFKAGMKVGDYIIKVNGEMISDLGFNKAVREMRGTPGTKVKLSVARDGLSKPMELELTREIVKINAVKSEIDNDIAYLRIVTFNEKTTQELKKTVNSIKNKNNIKGIILDLRNNPGGLLDQSIYVTEYFLKNGDIVSTQGRSVKSIKFEADPNVEKAPDVPMIVLINGGSASASEIVAGALQDHKRAIILGTKSFGKGSVQSLIPINDRSAMKITTAKYYTPSGRSIQAEGIKPDIEVEQAKIEYPSDKESKNKYSESSLKNHLKNDKIDQKNKNDKEDENKNKSLSEKYKNDFQYARAYDLIKALIITQKQ